MYLSPNRACSEALLCLHLTGLSYIDIDIDAYITAHGLALGLNVFLTHLLIVSIESTHDNTVQYPKSPTMIFKRSDYFSSVSKTLSN